MTTGLPFQENLTLLVESCRGLNETGTLVLEKAMARHVRNLRDLQAYVAEHPEVVDRPLDGAVVVTGLPRTGTTLLGGAAPDARRAVARGASGPGRALAGRVLPARPGLPRHPRRHADRARGV
jgi:hypothetical protein